MLLVTTPPRPNLSHHRSSTATNNTINKTNRCLLDLSTRKNKIAFTWLSLAGQSSLASVSAAYRGNGETHPRPNATTNANTTAQATPITTTTKGHHLLNCFTSSRVSNAPSMRDQEASPYTGIMILRRTPTKAINSTVVHFER